MEDNAKSITDSDIITECLAHGIDLHRLEACLGSHDNWGKMIHAFEYVTVLEAVLDAMKAALNNAEEYERDNWLYAVETWKSRALEAEANVKALCEAIEDLRMEAYSESYRVSVVRSAYQTLKTLAAELDN